MSLSAQYIRTLPGDAECIDALAYLAAHVQKYPSGGFTPPLRPKARASEEAKFLAVSLRIARKTRQGAGARISRVDWCIDQEIGTADGDDSAIAEGFSSRVLRRAYSGYLLVTSGEKRGALDVWLSSQGEPMLKLGYTLSPVSAGGGVIFVIIRKGKLRWTLVYFHTVSGADISTGLAFANRVDNEYASRDRTARAISAATAAYSRWLLSSFGVAMKPTAGMIAMDAARVTLPSGFQKWRTPPLLVAMEREGRGYRGGMSYAERFRGKSYRIDVTRQYTHALRGELPIRTAFGRRSSYSDSRPGVFMCRVFLSNMLAYPLGVWYGNDAGFRLETVGRGTYVCVLHSAEFQGLRDMGATVIPSYGFIYTATFGMAEYVATLQRCITAFGRSSPEAIFSKPLGNYVYGKFGQKPRRTELMFSEENPGKQWYPYWDDQGAPWEQIWERTVERYTASQHVDIAGTVTAAARSQTVSTWASLLRSGARVVRCHTDSLTIDVDPTELLNLSDETIGSWRLENESPDSIMIGANAYFDQDGAHIAGVSEPTFEMIDRLLDGQVVGVRQTIKAPRRGFTRGEMAVDREYRARG